MIPHVQLEWFIAEHKTESPPSIRIDGLLQIQLIEWNHVFNRLHAWFLDHLEMKLVIDHPVIGDVENRAIFQKKLREVFSFVAVDVNRSLGRLQDVIRRAG